MDELIILNPEEPKFLSEAISINQFIKGKINFINVGTGGGKTTFATSILPQLASDLSKIVYLIDGVNMRDKLANEPNMELYSDNWKEVSEGNMLRFVPHKIAVMTYQKFGVLCKKYPEFINQLELIICDEVHKAIEFTEWDTQRIKKLFPAMKPAEVDMTLAMGSYSYIALKVLKEMGALTAGDAYVVFMTATPNRVDNLFNELLHRIEASSAIVSYRVLEDYYYSNLYRVIRSIPKGSKTLVYMPYIKDMKMMVEYSEKLGLKSAAIWSENNRNYKMSDFQLGVKDHVIFKEEFPAEVEILFINKASETGLNLRGDVNNIIIHSQDEDTIIQVTGRYRGDVERRFLLDPNWTRIDLEPEWLNVRLYKDDRDRLADHLSIKNNSGKPYKWKGVKDLILEQNIYTLTEGATNGNRWVLLKK